MMKNIFLDMDIRECSLRAGEAILSPVCTLVRTGRTVSLRFKSFPGNEEEILNRYLEKLPLLKLKNMQEHEDERNAEVLSPLVE
jgi:hypothetical protein